MQRKALNNQDKSGLDGVLEHIPPVSVCQFRSSLSISEPVAPGLLARLSHALFPYPVSKYPGRLEGMARLIGCTVSSYATYRKAAGDARLTVPVCRRAEKICSDMIERLTAIRAGLEIRRKALEAKQAPKRRGMLTVRVREPGGEPRLGTAWANRAAKNLKQF